MKRQNIANSSVAKNCIDLQHMQMHTKIVEIIYSCVCNFMSSAIVLSAHTGQLPGLPLM